MTRKWVYSSKTARQELTKALGHRPDRREMRILLGSQGTALAETAEVGFPVPPCFTITTEACIAYLETGKFPDDMWGQVLEALREIEEQTGKLLGDGSNPLLVSVRAGSRASMPGLMDSVLNLGMNDETCAALAELTGDEWFAYDTYRRFITMFSKIVMGYPREHFEWALKNLMDQGGVERPSEISIEGLRGLVKAFKQAYAQNFGEAFPSDPYEQLKRSIRAAFDSWTGRRTVAYRRDNSIPDDWGVAASVCTRVFGNLAEESGTGVLFTRNPASGDRHLYGEYLEQGRAEDVMLDVRAPERIHTLCATMPDVYEELVHLAQKLERAYDDMQDIAFTVEQGKLWLLRTGPGKRTAQAALKIAVDMVDEGLLSREEALMRLRPDQVDRLLYPIFDPAAKEEAEQDGALLVTGEPLSPGAATGKIALDADRALALNAEGEAVILVRPMTCPDEVPAMLASVGLLTQSTNPASNAAVVILASDLPAVTGIGTLEINHQARRVRIGGRTLAEGTTISLDGSTGEVFLGRIPVVDTVANTELHTLFGLINQVTEGLGAGLEVRANADDPTSARQARQFGAKGIGFCRTEHMFFDERTRDALMRVIVAETREGRQAALDEMLPCQEEDFEQIFEVMNGLPIAMRLIDPPLHEFLPSRDKLIEAVARLRHTAPDSPKLAEMEKLLQVVNSMWEINPMMGLRGCRVGILVEGLTEMQVRAYFQAACRCAKRGVEVHPEVIIPMVSHVNEFKLEREKLEAVARQVMEEEGIEVGYKFGAMIETPRAALTAGEIAPHADFFSLGTNDLTQMTFGYSRDDVEDKFLASYVDGIETGERGPEGNLLLFPILEANPFRTLDQPGVGRLIRICVQKGRAANPNLEIGLCGQHAGDPASINFCNEVGLDYVSCSHYRVPVARLAAAQAAIRSGYPAPSSETRRRRL